MGVFGGSTTKTKQVSTQVGASDSGIATSINVGKRGSYAETHINEFPDTVADFATAALGLAGQSVAGANAAIAQLGDVAVREKTPLTEWLPIVAIGGAVVAFGFWAYRG